jgi:hypothetical protein
MTKLFRAARRRIRGKILKFMNLERAAQLSDAGFLKEMGWFASAEIGSVVDGKGQPIPWLTYGAIDFLQARVPSEAIVFEYGCGSSTLWWAERIKTITSVEHDREWFSKISPRLPANASVSHFELMCDGDYCRAITRCDETFDIVVVDGRDRVNCVRAAIAKLSDRGVIIWDNTDREKYRPGIDFLSERGFRRIWFAGLTAIATDRNETSIFYRDDNCLGL